ncbi:Mannosylglycerate hydrolase [Limihaloglobus sulfuriphilus]|uniref:Mannosylglycerate hydrolase n=1 Tax=Limihaloglobus sulfuriphilus TaxID=1851148 RepID=A0A1Q2MCX4_9BACT|nr:glycoside hydrolase family 38 C-terminal domain-containing protein [Limihaloglobus sulfuriphilus]AQQ70157.1 Mannosylglycerate hydrolase [Limihaloglobus sulfuriphilus]
MASKKTVHVISGTHWDREWRFTADQSLLRLAELVDELLDILEANPDYKCFLLDGGTVVIEDYLNVRPENEQRLRDFMSAGRIETVMWYTLPEMSTVAPEALVRNLLIGKRIAAKFGGCINAGYTATSYGQISQLAQIYAGFGTRSALSYRGTNKQQVPPICKLESPDGTQIYHIRCFDEVTRTNWFFFPHYMLVLGKAPRDLSTKWNPAEWPVHMADDALYQSAFQMKNESMEFNRDPETIRKAARMLGAQAEPQMINNQLLALDMEDNAVPYQRLPEMIQAINKAQDEYLIKQSSLDEYVEACVEGLDPDTVPVHIGEMRYTLIEAGFNGLLGATHSSRINLKLLNDLAQRELINTAEPLSAMSSMLGGSYESSLLHRAWLYLLKNHAHDSICGAAIDEAHKDNPFRFRAATSIARECSRKACEQIWAKMDTQSGFQEKDVTLTFFNTLPISRKRVEHVVVDVPRPDFGAFKIEPCTGVGPIVEGFNPDDMLTFQYFDIVDQDGNKIKYEILDRENIDLEVERKLDTNAAVYDIQRNRLLIEVELPAMGYKTYAVRPRKREYNPEPKPAGERGLIASQKGVLENEHLRVQINSDGTFNILNKKTAEYSERLHYFCDDASTGNAHKHKGTLRDFTVTSLGCNSIITLIENNTLRATWKVELAMMIPDRADHAARDRSHSRVELPVEMYLTLRKDSNALEIKTVIENTAKDHRLRIMMPTGVKTDYAYADGPFDVLKRSLLWDDTKDNMEEYHPYKPMQRFVTLSDDSRGFSFISKGLGEYEVIDDSDRTLAITLMRTSRAYMRANRGVMTPAEYEQNLGQHLIGIGKLEFEYAIYPHEGDWRQAGVHLVSDDFRGPVRVLQGVPKAGELSAEQSLIQISPAESMQVSAFFWSRESKGYILRLWNAAETSVEAKIKLAADFSNAAIVSLDEERIEQNLDISGGSVAFNVPKSRIVTLLLK